MFEKENSINGITVSHYEKGVFKVSGEFKVSYDELSKTKQKEILELIVAEIIKKTES